MTASNPPSPTSGQEIDDILTSIRESVAQESTKVGQGTNDLPDSDPDDDILELTAAEMAAPTPEQAATPAAAASEDTADVLGIPALPPSEAADEFDRLLAEIGQEKQQRAAVIEAQKEALLADIEPLGAESAQPEATPPAPADFQSATDLASPLPSTAPGSFNPAGATVVNTLETAAGMQLVLPAEVLAVALRPMVQGWLDANLPAVVERLVQAEIAKLNNNDDA